MGAEIVYFAFFSRFPTEVTERTFEQTELLKLGNHWMKSQSHTYFNILRDRQAVCSYEDALKSKEEKLMAEYPALAIEWFW